MYWKIKQNVLEIYERNRCFEMAYIYYNTINPCFLQTPLYEAKLFLGAFKINIILQTQNLALFMKMQSAFKELSYSGKSFQ